MHGAMQTESEFASANVIASESFSSIRTVAAFSMEAQIQDLYRGLLSAPAKAASKTALIGCAGVRDEIAALRASLNKCRHQSSCSDE